MQVKLNMNTLKQFSKLDPVNVHFLFSNPLQMFILM